MDSRLPNRLLRTLLSLSLALSVGLQFQSAAHAESSPAVVVETPSTCSEEFSAQLVKELRIRTAAHVLFASNELDNPVQWRLAIERADDTSCAVRLEGADDTNSFVTTSDADQVQIAAVANRLAWIIDEPPDGTTSPTNGSDEGTSNTSVPEGIALGERGNQQRIELDEGGQRLRRDAFSLETIGGAMWIQSTGASLGLARIGARWQPRSRLSFHAMGRLPLSTARDNSGGYQFQYRPWALGLATTFSQRLSSRFTLRVGGGARWTTFQIQSTPLSTQQSQALTPNNTEGVNESAGHNAAAGQNSAETQNSTTTQNTSPDQANHTTRDDAEDISSEQAQDPPVTTRERNPEAEPQARMTGRADTTLQNTLVPWSVTAMVGTSYRLNDSLSLRLDIGAALHLAHRQIRDDQRVVMDLGRLDVDAMAGFELRF